MDVRVQIPALFVDEIRDNSPTADIAVINAVPEDGELSVPTGADIRFHVVGFTGFAVDPGTLYVTLVRSSSGSTDLVYDGASGSFQAGYSGSVNFRQSIGSAVNDEALFVIEAATPFTSNEVITVRVQGLAGGAVLDTTYAFSVADETPPEILSVWWLDPTRCIVKFDEVVSSTTVSNHYASDSVSIEDGKIIFRGADLSAYGDAFVGVRGSDAVLNNTDNEVSSTTYRATSMLSEVVPVLSSYLTDDSGKDYDSQGIVIRERLIRGSVCYFSLTPTPENETGYRIEDSIQVSYSPLIKDAVFLSDDDVPPGGSSGQYVKLTLDEEVSFGRLYTLQCWATDQNSNMGLATLSLTTPDFGLDLDEDVGYWTPGIQSPVDMAQDLTDGDGFLRKQSVVHQDALNIARYRSYQVKYLRDPWRCPDAAVEFLLADRMNPFRFPLGNIKLMRRCSEYLPALYRTKGTHAGIEQFILDVLGIGSEIIAFWPGDGWILDDPVWSVLGNTTTLYPGDAYGRNCYDILVLRDLTAWERTAVREICEWSDPMGMHLIDIIEPSMVSSGQATVPGSTYWIVGTSTLGNTTYVSP